MSRNNYTPPTGVKSRLSVYVLLIFSVFILYTCDNVPTNSVVEEDPDQNHDITNPIPDTTDAGNSDGDGPDDGDGSNNDQDPSDGDDTDDENPPHNGDEDEELPDDEPNTPPVTKSGFDVYDGMNLRNKPSAIAQAGVKPIDVHYAGPIFGISARDLPGTMHLPSKSRVLELARQTARSGVDKAVIDIEHWPTQTREGSPSKIQQSVNNFKTVLEWFREGAPNVKWGYYGEFPIRNYWDAIEPPSSSAYKSWMAQNDNLKEAAEQVDILYPSIYTFYDRPQEWVTYAKAQIAEARRLNPDAEIIVYLWPVYHMSNKAGLAGKLIDADFWRLQLETVREHADGVAIYLSSSFNFSTSHPWWQVTKEFIKELED